MYKMERNKTPPVPVPSYRTRIVLNFVIVLQRKLGIQSLAASVSYCNIRLCFTMCNVNRFNVI